MFKEILFIEKEFTLDPNSELILKLLNQPKNYYIYVSLQKSVSSKNYYMLRLYNNIPSRNKQLSFRVSKQFIYRCYRNSTTNIIQAVYEYLTTRDIDNYNDIGCLKYSYYTKYYIDLLEKAIFDFNLIKCKEL